MLFILIGLKCLPFLFNNISQMAFQVNTSLSLSSDSVCLVAQSCLTVCDPMDYSPPGSSVHRDSPGKNFGESCHALLQGIFPTQGSNLGLPHFSQILYCLGHQGSPNGCRVIHCQDVEFHSPVGRLLCLLWIECYHPSTCPTKDMLKS